MIITDQHMMTLWQHNRPLNSYGFTGLHVTWFLLPFSQYHNLFFISHDFTNSERIFPQAHCFLKEQKQAAYSNFAEEHISSMINITKTMQAVAVLYL